MDQMTSSIWEMLLCVAVKTAERDITIIQERTTDFTLAVSVYPTCIQYLFKRKFSHIEYSTEEAIQDLLTSADL